MIMVIGQTSGIVSDDLLRKFQCILPENVILAALDIIDCESGELNHGHNAILDTITDNSNKICPSTGLSTVRSPWLNCHI